MNLVYCATPSRLIANIKEIMDFVQSQNAAPFHPFMAFPYERFEGGAVGREKTMEFCCRCVNTCEEFWLFGISEGTLLELNYAIDRNKTIRLFLEEFDPEWRKVYQRLKKKFSDPLKKLQNSNEGAKNGRECR